MSKKSKKNYENVKASVKLSYRRSIPLMNGYTIILSTGKDREDRGKGYGKEVP